MISRKAHENRPDKNQRIATMPIVFSARDRQTDYIGFPSGFVKSGHFTLRTGPYGGNSHSAFNELINSALRFAQKHNSYDFL